MPLFDTTGYALKIINNGNVVKTLYDRSVFSKGVDAYNYNTLSKAFPQYAADDDYFSCMDLNRRAWQMRL